MKQKGIRDSDEYRPGCPECEEKRDGYGTTVVPVHETGGRRLVVDGDRVRIPVARSTGSKATVRE